MAHFWDHCCTLFVPVIYIRYIWHTIVSRKAVWRAFFQWTAKLQKSKKITVNLLLLWHSTNKQGPLECTCFRFFWSNNISVFEHIWASFLIVFLGLLWLCHLRTLVKDPFILILPYFIIIASLSLLHSRYKIKPTKRSIVCSNNPVWLG